MRWWRKEAIADGTTLDEFRDDFDGIVEKHGWSYNGSRGWHSRVIFDTNVNMAYAPSLSDRAPNRCLVASHSSAENS